MKKIINPYEYKKYFTLGLEYLEKLRDIESLTNTISSAVIHTGKRKVFNFRYEKEETRDPVIRYKIKFPYTTLILKLHTQYEERQEEAVNDIIIGLCQEVGELEKYIEEPGLDILSVDYVENNDLKNCFAYSNYFRKKENEELERVLSLNRKGELRGVYKVLFIPEFLIMEGELDFRFKSQNNFILDNISAKINEIKETIREQITRFAAYSDF